MSIQVNLHTRQRSQSLSLPSSPAAGSLMQKRVSEIFKRKSDINQVPWREKAAIIALTKCVPTVIFDEESLIEEEEMQSVYDNKLKAFLPKLWEKQDRVFVTYLGLILLGRSIYNVKHQTLGVKEFISYINSTGEILRPILENYQVLFRGVSNFICRKKRWTPFVKKLYDDLKSLSTLEKVNDVFTEGKDLAGFVTNAKALKKTTEPQIRALITTCFGETKNERKKVWKLLKNLSSGTLSDADKIEKLLSINLIK